MLRVSERELAMLGAIYLPVANAIYFVRYTDVRYVRCAQVNKKLQPDKESSAHISLLQAGEGGPPAVDEDALMLMNI